MENLPNLTGKSEITLNEFCGHMAIIYNETGGTCKPIREMGGPQYMFNTVMPGGGVKYSYNTPPNHKAGDQLMEWGIINTEEQRSLWNGTIYPKHAPEDIKKAALKCDFYRFRGYGFNQLTWRNAYEQCLQPLLPRPMDEYSVEEFEAHINNVKIAAQAFSIISTKMPMPKINTDLVSGNFRPMVCGSGIGLYVTQYCSVMHT
ncbi:hypothetical protein, partial [Microscilla marina]